MIKLTINEREIEVERPVPILEAAKEAGIKIPTLCSFEGLTPYGGCRLCLVEIEKVPKLQTSCTVHVTDGMVVRTESEPISKARKAMLEFLLINHPLDCPFCDKAGECDLQDLTTQYGASEGKFKEGKRRHPESFDDPIIVRNMERCILCTRCVRMCDGLQGAYAITVTGRGNHSFVEPFSGGRYNCEYCGNCLTVCPVGAIMSRLHRHSYRPWFIEREIETVCGFCGVGCSMVLQMRGNSIIRTMPRMGLGLNNGLLCVRGRFGYDYVDNRERLATPLMKVNGNFKLVSWEEAISFVAKRLKEIKDTHGGKSIGAIASGRCTNEDNYMLQKFVRFVLGSNNIDSSARLYYAPAEAYLERMFGQGITANLIPGIAKSDGVFVAGGDPTTINPILGLQLRASWRNGAKVIVLGFPGGLKRFIDDEWILSPYSDEIVLSAIVDKLVKEKGLRGENKAVEEKMGKLKIPSEAELSETGIGPDKISEISNDLIKMENPVVVIGPDIIQRERVSKNLFLLGAIAYLIKARIFLLSEKPNYQGLMDMGCEPDVLPGRRPIDLEMFRHKIEDKIGFRVPEDKGLKLFEMIDEAEKGGIKALYVMGENPLFSLPNRARIEKALSSLDFLVVQDIYLTETARMAHVVLPGASWSEKDGTFTNLGRRLQRVRKSRKSSPGREDWKTIADISQNIDVKKTYSGVEDVWEEIKQVSPLHSELSYEDLAGDKAIWPYHGEPLRGIEGDFSVEDLEVLPQVPVKEGPFLMLERPLYHSGSLSRMSKALHSISSEAYVMISTSLLEKIGLTDGEKARIKTKKGSLETIVKENRHVPEDMVFLSNTFEEASFMSLVDYSIDPFTGCVWFKDNAVKIEKIS